jgi:3-ketosteroid 9alpha-monooxygenase subunit B
MAIKPMDLVLSRIVWETLDTVTLFFQHQPAPDVEGEPRFEYKAGQFCTIDPHQFKQLSNMVDYLEQLKGKKEVTRAYSMSSAPSERELAVTVKEEMFTAGKTPYPPLLSGLLVHGLKEGMILRVVGFTGPYVLPEKIDGPGHILHVCAGSGIVPNFSILKEALDRDLPLRHTLLYANKTTQDIIFRDAIDALRARHPDKLKVVHALTREHEVEKLGPDYRKGRIDSGLLADALATDPQTTVYLCGAGVTPHEARAARKEGRTPEPRFLETMIEMLKALGVGKDRLHYESYG